MTPPIHLRSDLNAEDDDGENWALLANAGDQSEIQVGAVVVARTPGFWSVVRITAVDPDGQVHFVQLDENTAGAFGRSAENPSSRRCELSRSLTEPLSSSLPLWEVGG